MIQISGNVCVYVWCIQMCACEGHRRTLGVLF